MEIVALVFTLDQFVFSVSPCILFKGDCEDWDWLHQQTLNANRYRPHYGLMKYRHDYIVCERWCFWKIIYIIYIYIYNWKQCSLFTCCRPNCIALFLLEVCFLLYSELKMELEKLELQKDRLAVKKRADKKMPDW